MEDDKSDYVITPITFTATTSTVSDDSYDVELSQIDEDIQFRREEINRLESEIETLRTQIYGLDNKRYNLMELIGKENTGGKQQ